MILFGVNFNLYYLLLKKKMEGRGLPTEVRSISRSSLLIALITINIAPLFSNMRRNLCVMRFQVNDHHNDRFATTDFDLYVPFQDDLVFDVYIGCAPAALGAESQGDPM